MNEREPQDSHLFPLNFLYMLPPDSSSLTSITPSPSPLPSAPLPQIQSSCFPSKIREDLTFKIELYANSTILKNEVPEMGKQPCNDFSLEGLIERANKGSEA